MMDLKNRIKAVYENLIETSELKDNSIDLSLPIFLNTGDAIDIKITYENDKVILTNLLYRSVEESLDSHYSQLKIRKEYLLNKKRFNRIRKEYLSDNQINYSLKLEKTLNRDEFEKNLEELLFKYTFFITRYYNYIYDYIVENSKEKQKEFIFKNEIRSYVKNFNKKNTSKKIVEFDKKKLGVASKYNEYYDLADKVIFTGINTKFHLLEALRDLKGIINMGKNSNKKIYVYIDQLTKTELTKEYVIENLNTFKELEIESVYIKNLEELKIIDKKLELYKKRP